MSYNREWDRGKTDAAYSSNYDEYNAQGKRRKFNSGGYQAYDNSQYDDSTAYDPNMSQGRNGQSQDFSQDRNRSGNFPKKRLQPSEPSPHVIFLGLDPDFTEADLQAFLNSYGCSVETVTIIRERSTGSCPFVFTFAYALTFLAIRFIKVLPRALDLPSFQVLNTLVHSWIRYSLSSQCHLRLHMVRSPLKLTTRLLKLVLHTMDAESKSTTPKALRPMKKVVSTEGT
ncbi:hypothetical protein VKT23_003973 [Stygiomarasmius scandens]|uniref:RRM domain-containing protein n=1 Tax=Marasmiellus scandens TaxID=2682957 RepID=A0ABR1JYJ4_9AGAR